MEDNKMLVKIMEEFADHAFEHSTKFTLTVAKRIAKVLIQICTIQLIINVALFILILAK